MNANDLEQDISKQFNARRRLAQNVACAALWLAAGTTAAVGGINWTFLGPTSGAAEALAVSGNTLYVGGNFTNVGGVAANNIAAWNGTNWSALGEGLTGSSDSSVFGLAMMAGKLYAGGYFTAAGGSPATNVAQWDGTNWSALGSGVGVSSLSFGVNALAVSGNTLYAGGSFTNVGGITTSNIAQWDGTKWSALGSGLVPNVFALAVSGTTLYAGTRYDSTWTNGSGGVAEWNGTNWSGLLPAAHALESLSPVSAFAVSGSNLYAGGGFPEYVGQWNGSGWASMGGGLLTGGYWEAPYSEQNPGVHAIAITGGTFYAGGCFNIATTNPLTVVTNIAQWDGTNWSQAGPGLIGTVQALVVKGNVLYAAGTLFTNIFDTTPEGTPYALAMANLPVSLQIVTNDSAFGFNNGAFGFNILGPLGSKVVVQASADLRNWIPLQTNLLGPGLLYFSDTRPPNNTQQFYRVIGGP